jgi:hypothetical protein
MEEPKPFRVWCCTLLSSASLMFSSYLLPCHPPRWEIINNIQIFHINVSKMPSGVPFIRRCRVLYGPIWVVLGTLTGHWDCKCCLTCLIWHFGEIEKVLPGVIFSIIVTSYKCNINWAWNEKLRSKLVPKLVSNNIYFTYMFVYHEDLKNQQINLSHSSRLKYIKHN